MDEQRLNPLPPSVAIQFWSVAGITPQIRDQIEEILSGEQKPEERPTVSEGEPVSTSDAPPLTTSAPWADKPATLARIRELARELRVYCGAPRLTAQTRDILREEKVIK